MSAIVFLDTKFTQFIRVELLSLGMVTLSNESTSIPRKLYVELDMSTEDGQARRKSSSDFVKWDGVLTQWELVPGVAATEREMGRRAGEWLPAIAEATGGRVEIAFYSGRDSNSSSARCATQGSGIASATSCGR